MAFYFDQQERLKTKKGKELLDAVHEAEPRAEKVAAAPKPVDGNLQIRPGKKGAVEVHVKSGRRTDEA